MWSAFLRGFGVGASAPLCSVERSGSPFRHLSRNAPMALVSSGNGSYVARDGGAAPGLDSSWRHERPRSRAFVQALWRTRAVDPLLTILRHASLDGPWAAPKSPAPVPRT